MRFIAQITAYLLHPIFIPIYLLVFLMNVEPVMSLYFGGDRMWTFLLIMFVNLVLGPIFSLVILKKNGWLDSFSMPSLKGRSVAYLITAIWYLLTYFMVQKIGLPIVTRALFIALIATLLILAAVSIKHKTSAHVASLAGAMGVLVWMFTFYGIWEMKWFMGMIILIGIQASARMYLQAHSDKEILSGFLIGSCTTFFCMWFIIG